MIKKLQFNKTYKKGQNHDYLSLKWQVNEHVTDKQETNKKTEILTIV